MSPVLSHSIIINETLVGFVEQPQGRGTLTILFTCLLTLSLCVWSAVHLDLPEHHEGSFSYTIKYIRWSLLGVFGPELLIWIAWRQYMSACALTSSVNELGFSKEKDNDYQGWSVVHSFYTGMGGFVFDLDDPDLTSQPPFVPKLRRLHVTARGVQLLAHCNLLPSLPQREILDKSKTDVSAKLICCVQVLWIVAQAATRLAYGLALAPLEINTIAHVACALLMYALWWSKPRGVRQPTRLKGPWVREMAAFMYMSSQVSAAHRAHKDVLRNFGVKTEIASLICVNEEERLKESWKTPSVVISEDNEEVDSSSSTIVDNDDFDKRFPGRTSNSQDYVSVQPCDFTTSSEEDLATMEQVRWHLCCAAIDRYPPIRARLRRPARNAAQARFRDALQLYPTMPPAVQARFHGSALEDEPDLIGRGREWTCLSEELVVDQPRNWPGDELLLPVQGHLMGAVLWTASTVYGAVHLAGWHEIFPTRTEAWLWRMAAAYLVFAGLLWSLLNLIARYSPTVWLYWYNLLAGDVQRRSYTVIYGLSAIGGTLYVLARTYLVVEAFVSLRALPAAAYQSPSWILTVPHLG